MSRNESVFHHARLHSFLSFLLFFSSTPSLPPSSREISPLAWRHVFLHRQKCKSLATIDTTVSFLPETGGENFAQGVFPSVRSCFLKFSVLSPLPLSLPLSRIRVVQTRARFACRATHPPLFLIRLNFAIATR